MKFLVLVSIFISFSAAATPLDDLIKQTWDHSPLIKSQAEVVKAAELDRFVRFLPNSPTLTYADSDNQSWKTYGVSLLVGFPGQAFALSKVDSVLLKSQEAEMNAKKIELARFVVSVYSTCASTKELLAILDEAVKELDTLKEAITARYEMGQSTQAERIGIDLQHRQANIEFMALVDQSRTACAKLSQYLEENKIDKGYVVKLAEDISPELLSQMGDISLDVIRADNEAKSAEVEADIAFWRSAPDITLSYYRNYYNKVQASPIVPTQWTSTYLVSLNIPIFFPFYERNDIRKARAFNIISAERARMKKLQSERDVLDSSNAYIRGRQVLQKLVARDLPMAETMIDSTYAAYKQGKLGFSELILAKRTWLDLKKEEVNLKLSLVNNRLNCLNACERN